VELREWLTAEGEGLVAVWNAERSGSNVHAPVETFGFFSELTAVYASPHESMLYGRRHCRRHR